jgi:hypothetical protein
LFKNKIFQEQFVSFTGLTKLHAIQNKKHYPKSYFLKQAF